MKKYILILSLLLSAIIVHAQASTIADKGNSITIQWDDGDTVSVAKLGAMVYPENSKTYIVPPGGTRYGRNRVISLEPTDFGYATNTLLWLYVDAIVNRNFNEQYKYTSGNLDTAYMIYSIDTVGYWLYGYTTDTLRSKIWIAW